MGRYEEVFQRSIKDPEGFWGEAAVVMRLPKTRSGKILRSTMRKIADGEKYTTPSTIDDPAILGEIEIALKRIGYAARTA